MRPAVPVKARPRPKGRDRLDGALALGAPVLIQGPMDVARLMVRLGASDWLDLRIALGDAGAEAMRARIAQLADARRPILIVVAPRLVGVAGGLVTELALRIARGTDGALRRIDPAIPIVALEPTGAFDRELVARFQTCLLAARVFEPLFGGR